MTSKASLANHTKGLLCDLVQFSHEVCQTSKRLSFPSKCARPAWLPVSFRFHFGHITTLEVQTAAYKAPLMRRTLDMGQLKHKLF